ncbi:sensor domain-containing protein [Nocardia sp. AG03]|uniref:sensor domain-containing protein n=1 Tax=Nocardia sp. AG03 TaxID=3025312 RepID=UPI00241828F8|nr:sensor domain-containing protein [Nocardia sp. AG03]
MNVAETTPDRALWAVRGLLCGVAVGAVAVLAGCGQSVSGTPVAGSAVAVRHVEGALVDLLPAPDRFPARYPAVVLPPQAAAAAAGDLDGVGAGATVRPATCTPPEPEPGAEPAAVAVGTDDATRTSLTVELSRTSETMDALRDRLAGCEQIRVSRAGAETVVSTTLDQSVPDGADDAVSLRRTVVPEVGGAGLTQTMRTSVGQLGDVRITVTSMTFGDTAPDTAAVDELFATTVRSVRGE